jgi:DNA invertase Pin-like site-specific DNA recombinase
LPPLWILCVYYNVKQYVGIYARVSTDDVRQTTSYELQKKYYEDFVVQHPNWELVEIYADEGISGTSLLISQIKRLQSLVPSFLSKDTA